MLSITGPARLHRAILLVACLAIPSWLAAQDASGCSLSPAPGEPRRQILTCGAGLSIEREPGAALRIFARAGDAPPRTIQVQGGAVLIEATPGAPPTSIRTPHAIAAVRGTTYVVDAGAQTTSVFVIDGAVSVRRPDDASTVVLGAGQGVDVTDGAPLSKVTWGAARVAALLARFGR